MIRTVTVPVDQISLTWLMSHAERRGECLVWTGATTQDGYGEYVRDRRHHLAHRAAVALDGRDLPDGTVIDHLCRNRLCVEATHLEVVTPLVNTARGRGATAAAVRSFERGVCLNGHDLSVVGVHKQGLGRTCAECGRLRVRRYRMRKLAAANGGAK